MKNFHVAVLLFCIGLALLPASASAQSGKTVVVHQRNADITIQPNGDTQFVETWVTEFQNGTFTFAFRDIPTDKVRELANVQVFEGDQPLQTDIDSSNTSTKITWHFPETNQGVNYFSDTHTFTLRYTLRGALRIYPTGDQFWWKFIEVDRAYTIESAKVTLHLPGDFPTNQLYATTYQGSRDLGGAHILDNKTIEFAGGPFPPQNQWELRAQFPPVIAAPPEAWQQQLDAQNAAITQNNFYAVWATVILAIGGALALLLLWFLLGRDKPTTFAAEFLAQPPEDTPPGVVGTLLDERADMQDIVATIADLAQRGYLRIHESDGFGTPAFEALKGDESKLAPFEQKTLDALLRGETTRRLEDVQGSFYYSLNDLQNALYDEMVSRGYFPASPLATRDLYFRIGKIGALLLPIVGLVLWLIMLQTAPLLFLPFVILEILCLVLLQLSRIMPKRTDKGALAAAQWNAFKRYLANLEKYTNVADAKTQFAAYLPYAIAFGLEKSWIEKFSEVETPAPAWYIPYSTANDWSWRDVGKTPPHAESEPAASTPGTLSVKPIFPESSPSDAPRPASLNVLANNSFVGLNNVSTNIFSFLNDSARAFAAKPATQSTTDQVLDGAGSFLHWLVAPSGNSSSSGSSWSSSSSTSFASSSHSSWSGGGSHGGGGGGGGSSGFG